MVSVHYFALRRSHGATPGGERAMRRPGSQRGKVYYRIGFDWWVGSKMRIQEDIIA